MMKLRTKVCSLSLAISAVSSLAYAQDPAPDVEEVMVTGIRASLQNAIAEKREATNLIEVIKAEDIGKLPDQNLAEVLENITGVQITREAGVGTGVQIRGTDENRVQINGVSTVSSGTDRGGISFEDIDASIIAAVEVTKAPEAKTTEGSVGGTVNLRTIRPLELKDTLGSLRIQAEDSSLSTDSATPRVSGAYGDNWSTSAGEFGFVVSGSYTESDVSHFRPRLDRDNLVTCTGASAPAACANVPDSTPGVADTHFLGVQFLNQVYTNQEYKTKNLAMSFEWAPNDDVKLYLDTVLNDQERRSESYRAQFSGVSNTMGASDKATVKGSNFTATSFTEYNLGSFTNANGTQDLGSRIYFCH